VFSSFFFAKNNRIILDTKNPYNVLPELLAVPLTLDKAFELTWLDNYQINDIASTLVERLYIKKEKHDKQEITYFQKVELRLCFPGHIIKSLSETREFLNIHQVGKNREAVKNRAIIEATFLELPFELFDPNSPTLDYINDERLHYLRPKYVLCHDVSRSSLVGKFTSLQYGNFTAVLEEHAKHRATFTFYDSLTPILDNPTHTFYACYQNKSPYEGQVFGHIGIAEDVKYFLVNATALVLEREAIELLKTFGKPIYNSVTGEILFKPLDFKRHDGILAL